MSWVRQSDDILFILKGIIYKIFFYFQNGDNLGLEVRKPRRPFLHRVWRFLQVTATGVIKRDSKRIPSRTFLPIFCPEPKHLDLELPQRYRPSTIQGLCQATGWVVLGTTWCWYFPCHRFSPMEVKRLYWSFKNECPSGMVTQETFHDIFSKLFPTGGLSQHLPLTLTWDTGWSDMFVPQGRDTGCSDIFIPPAWDTGWSEIFAANLSSYSHYIFNTMDRQNTGTVTFEVSPHY